MTDRSNEEQMKVPDTPSDNPAPVSSPGAGARAGAKSASRALTWKAARHNTTKMVTAALEIPKIAIWLVWEEKKNWYAEKEGERSWEL